MPDNKTKYSERLVFDEEQGYYENDHLIPYRVYYYFNCPTSHLVDEKNPGLHKVTPNSGGGDSVCIYIHESVPEQFEDVVFIHELVEAEYRFHYNLDSHAAHMRAIAETNLYAKKHLSKKGFEVFKKWQQTLEAN
jgi:hypothetical protein